MRLTHIAVWTEGLEAAVAFWRECFDVEVRTRYDRQNQLGLRFHRAGLLASAPPQIGDGYYEAVVRSTENTPLRLLNKPGVS